MVRFAVVSGVLALLMAVAPKVQAQDLEPDPERVDVSSMTHEELCELVRQCQRGIGSERCREARRGAREAWRRLLARLDNLESRLSELENSDLAGVKDELDTLRSELNELLELLMELARLMGIIEDRLLELQERGQADQLRQDQNIRAAMDAIEDLRRRVELLEYRSRRFQLGMMAGALTMYSFDGTDYTSFLVGPRVSVRVARDLNFFFEMQATFSLDDHPFGLRARGGLQVELLPNEVIFESGVSTLWSHYNNSFQAASLFGTADVGMEVRPVPWLGLGAHVMGGVELDQDKPKFSLGVGLTAGFHLPRW